jgi:phosphate-selective porin
MPFKDLRFGFSVASSRLSEGLSSLALRRVVGEDLTAPTYWARGTRHRAGADVRWRPGPFSATAEFLSTADDRLGQGNRDQNLAPLRGTGWYVQGTWFLTGEPKAKDVRPRRPVRGGGPGAIEVILRTEGASIGTPGVWAIQAASPRAERPASSRIRAITTGLNWYPAAGARVQFNMTRETLTGASAATLQGLPTVVSSIVRFQLFL